LLNTNWGCIFSGVFHLRAKHEQHGVGINQNLHVLAPDHFVGRPDLVGVFDGVRLSRAAAITDAQADDVGTDALS
jgi:hypothetical protein